ncbi:high mobility group B protein 10-like [Argentina anserina]|uniref:high mobility group B protein 10-like n=1 Tax=Argentina anserina TaxID=57926 RepID=UPI0021769572|nr:high mobility group B protein 10-like [Potentilla anserina]
MSEVPATPITGKEAACPQQHQLLTPTANGSSSSSLTSTSKVYPPPSAEFDDVAQSSDLFWQKLKEFHDSLGTKFMIPTVGGKTLDLHLLFVEVTARGGIEKVIRDRQWKEVIMAFKFPTTITSASFVLRKYYLSLLYDFEQVYYFRKEVLRIPDPEEKNLDNGSERVQGIIRFQGQATPVVMQPGGSIVGTIDSKCDEGYVITVNLGSEVLTGALYHHPVAMSQNFSEMPTQRHRKRSRLAARDPSRPKSNRSGYNFFFAEHYSSLKPLYYGQERAISKQIGFLWNNLTEDEKQVYQEKGLQDKERYKNEMMEYKAQQY